MSFRSVSALGSIPAWAQAAKSFESFRPPAYRSGIYETGILVGCLRKLERWTLSAILAEVRSSPLSSLAFPSLPYAGR